MTMIKRIFMALTLMATFTVTDIKANALAASAIVCTTYAPNNGTFTRTGYSVSVYTESGHPKGMYAVYLHHGQHYINFYNTWICIQGRNRFGYCSNWYVIR